uniref:Uncharacterized protein n=1 Tax=Romanomermis culicivorax TaxID=13658 RepID=A0A915I2F3_ROMCU
MVKQAEKKPTKSIFGFFRRKSNKDNVEETKAVQTGNISEKMQENVAPKRKISSKHSLTTPPFEAKLNWDTGKLFMPEDEHTGSGKVNIQIQYGDTSINEQKQQQQQQEQQQPFMYKKNEMVQEAKTFNVESR